MLLTSTRLCMVVLHMLTKAYYEGSYTPIPEVARRYRMNPRALYPAFKQLVKGGILKSNTGGAEPGYMFTRDPETISLYEILLILEGQTKNQCCMDAVRDLKCDCKDKSQCHFYTTFDSIIDRARKQFLKLSVAKMCKMENTEQEEKITI